MRIVSFLPSATEIVCTLGAEDQLVGVTHECDYPPSVRHLPKVTRTLISGDVASREIDRLVSEQSRTTTALYQLDVPLLVQLCPDVIVTQSLCDVCAVAPNDVQAVLAQLPDRPLIVNLKPQSLESVFDDIRQVASAIGIRPDDTIRGLQARVEVVAARSARAVDRPRVALLEWLDPPFSCGHWNPELVRLAGGREGLGKEGEPSRRLCWNDVMAFQPEVLFIACCGLDLDRTLRDLSIVQSDLGWWELPAVKTGRVYLADGSQYFNRPGPRLVDSLEMLSHALHPDFHPLPENVPAAFRVEGVTLGGPPSH